ncbi:MAG TPA: NAD(P)/FAD-dependent oxidoreductase [Casimicrobiaceae bacterium]|jgi:NADH dehydrogenase|nr:NAD(P)/FAD-dependent oxidoreductase [Casimicrobiaceae bacterium]
MSAGTPHRIVIVGGGAGGLPLASRLGDKLGRRGRAQVTLVDRNGRHLWKPLLHEVAAGRLDADVHGIDYLALAYWHYFRFRQGTVAALDRARHELTLDAVRDEDGELTLPRRVLRYDTLIFCVGSVSNDFGVAGVAQHAISLETPEEAERFHRHLLAACVRADDAAASGHPTGVDIVIIGAGATGVELAAEIRQTTHVHATYGLEHLDTRKDVRLIVVEAAERILPPLPEHIAKAATDLLGKLNVQVRTGERVTSVDETGVSTASGALYRADLVVWAAGIKAPEWLRNLDGLETGRGDQLVVTLALQTTRDPDIFAFGDCAACPWPEAGRAGAQVPPRAQAARQQAMLLVKSMRARLDGKPLPEFHFRDLGSLVSLGELSAVGTLMGRLVGGSLLIQGLIARWMYASLYKMHQAAILGYLGVALDTVGRFLRRHTEPRVKLH